MSAHTPNVEVDFLSNLFVRFPMAFSQVEARLFALALDSLPQRSLHLAFQLAFHDIIPDGYADGQPYAKLQVAMERLSQAIDDKALQQEKGHSRYLYLFSTLGLNPGSELVTGQFNPDLRKQLLDLGSKFTTAELEALLMRR